jgi:iron complex outermembrane receptor protein
LAAEESVLRTAPVSGESLTPVAATTSSGTSGHVDRGSYDGGGHRDRLDDVEWRSSSGVIAQVNGAYRDAVYVTAGIRAELNDGFAQDIRWSTLPLLGVAVVRSAGDVQVKWRAAYGKGIRAPRTASRETMSGYNRGRDGYGEDAIYRAAIAPESQQGIEAGLDVYVGRAFSLRATRFDQVASGLIQRVTVGVDSTDRSGSYGPRAISYALQNVGDISNRGWEIDGALVRGTLTMSGSYSLVSSTVRRLDATYSGDLQRGSRVLEVPANTGSLTAAWTGGRWLGSVTATRAWDWINYDRIGLADAVVHDTKPPGEPLGDWLRSYWRHYAGVTRLGAAFSGQLSPSLTAIVTGQNLLNQQRGEPDNITVVPGRTLTLGIRTSF